MHSCISENQEILKDENGKICLKCDLKNGIRDGKCIQYYPNGTIKSISNWFTGVQNGELIEYFENGRVFQTSMWVDGKLEGECVEYSKGGYIHKVKQYTDGRPKGLWVQFYEGYPMQAIQYVVVRDQTHHMNQWWVYDILGDVQKEASHYFSIYSEKGDSIKVGESGVIIVKLEAPKYGGYMKLVVGDFDGQFNPINPSQLDTINCVGFEGTVNYKFDEKGQKVIQGIILDGIKDNRYYEKEKKHYTDRYREIFFARTIEVY